MNLAVGVKFPQGKFDLEVILRSQSGTDLTRSGGVTTQPERRLVDFMRL
jgi:hypothetical protein